MASNRLKMNEDKTQLIWLGTSQQLDKITAQTPTLPNARVRFTTVVNDLGVLFDSQLTMADHIAALSQSCFFHLQRIRSINQSLTFEPQAFQSRHSEFQTLTENIFVCSVTVECRLSTLAALRDFALYKCT